MSQQKTILLVDDSAVAMMNEKLILRRAHKYAVLEAKDGVEAVAVAMAKKPDLIVMDVVMPRVNGIEACRLLRNKEATKDIPIILVTTRGEVENVEAGYAAGCSDYVTKPVNSGELLTKIANLIG
jgi:CheY-like chemotaxis protein